MEPASSSAVFRRAFAVLWRTPGFPRAVHLATERGSGPERREYHTLPEPRLSICLSGTAAYRVRRRGQMVTIRVAPGELIYAAPHCVFVSDPSARYRSLGVVFGEQLTRFLIARKKSASPRDSGHHFEDVFHSENTLGSSDTLLLRLLSSETRPSADRSLRLLGESLLLRSAALLDQPARRPPGGRLHHQWRAACQFVREHLDQPIDRQDVARFLRLHPNHVSRLFRTVGGEGFNAWLTRQRLERANALLEESTLNVSEVAQACGFRDPNYFARRFRALTGRRPSDHAER